MTDEPEERVEMPIEDVLPCEHTDIKEITEDHIVSENTYVVCAEVDMDLLESTESISNIEPVQEESSDSDESDVSSEGIYVLCFFGPLGRKVFQLVYILICFFGLLMLGWIRSFNLRAQLFVSRQI